MVITKLTGKWKISQNQPARNRSGIIDGLERVANQPFKPMPFRYTPFAWLMGNDSADRAPHDLRYRGGIKL